MSRKSSRPASGIVSVCHVCPPSIVLTTVPFAPLAQATDSLTALTPRSRAVVPLVCAAQRGPDCAIANTAAAAIKVVVQLNGVLTRQIIKEACRAEAQSAKAGKQLPAGRRKES